MDMQSDGWPLDSDPDEELIPVLDELWWLGLPADATDVRLSVEQLEELARQYLGRINDLRFDSAVYGQHASLPLYLAEQRFAEICRILGDDRVAEATQETTQKWQKIWDTTDIAAERERYEYFCEHGVWPPSD